MTVIEVIQRSAEFLARKGVDSPRLQAELLLAHVLKLPRMQLYLDFQRQLTPDEADHLRELVQRRGRREPLQHILGTTCFCGLEMAVNRHVLVPRPETELLAEAGWEFLRQLTPGDSGPRPVLDFGTGSGCLAVTLAVKCPDARVTAMDVSPDALAVAAQNAARHGVSDRIEFRESDGFASLPAGAKFDLIVSNPPYIPTLEIDTLQPEVRDFDPRAALDGGPDGLKFHRLLAGQATAFLAAGGRLMLELGDGQAAAVREIFEAENWIVEAIRPDYNQRLRIMIARRD
ncbi:MAG: peptide chain release factor N(5)-glutamine methyltransferase [Verrucomicrobia bacterium]|nr:peptide chain release factor N(5)-glutamine methyltransferase [Verrucomicrobiota bacterium]